MHPKTESIIDFLLDSTTRLVVTAIVAALVITTVLVAAAPDKPTYQDMAEQTIIVQTGRTECHYVPAWQTVSCVTLPPTYGPVEPALPPAEFK
jgi:hypothetical protein